MPERPKAPRGTFDILPADANSRARLHELAAGAFRAAGYGRIETPAFEQTDLFARAVGEATDIVTKEMFSFHDQGGRELTLRPEGTAPICRAYVEHGMHKLPQPVKLWYSGAYFRHERPQAGRFRQFHQIGVEAIGTDDPMADAETIILLDQLLRSFEVPGVTLRVGSLGTVSSRAAYRDELREYLRAHQAELATEVRERIEQNPLRAFDSDHDGTRAVMAQAPQMIDRLDDADAEHLAAVERLLRESGVEFERDGSLVRGLDYYTRTVFEFTSDALGAQSALGGGGRYDGLIDELGGPPTAAVGWAAGVERILLAVAAEPPEPTADVYVAAEGDAERERAFALVTELRRAGMVAHLDLARRSIKGQMKQADKAGARHAVLIEADGASVRDMSSGEHTDLDLAHAVEVLSS